MKQYSTFDPIPQDIPEGYCHCGCGRKTNLAPHSSKRQGWVVGKPVKYILGHGNRVKRPISAFWSKVDRRADGECWEWQGFRDRQGYGRLRFCGTNAISSRIAYSLAFGEIPDGKSVCHKCDNPPCCNPSHLFLGSRVENRMDAVRKERQARGERNGMAVLTELDVLEIRRLASLGINRYTLSSMFLVSYDAIRLIVLRETWRHI